MSANPKILQILIECRILVGSYLMISKMKNMKARL